jgi:ZIP family zinc transporter
VPLYLQALIWGLVSGSALVIGATLAYSPAISTRMIATIMAFGSGALVSALAFDLLDEAFHLAGFRPVAGGFLLGAVLFTLANIVVTRVGGKHRKRSGRLQQKAHEGAGLAIAAGALLDGIPESVVIGVTLDIEKGVALTALIAIFLSNLPEALASASGMRKAGRSTGYIFSVWGGIAIVSGIAAMIGNLLFSGADPVLAASASAIAAGAILAMLADTMIPEAFETVHEYTGLITALGFLSAFWLSKAIG